MKKSRSAFIAALLTALWLLVSFRAQAQCDSLAEVGINPACQSFVLEPLGGGTSYEILALPQGEVLEAGEVISYSGNLMPASTCTGLDGIDLSCVQSVDTGCEFDYYILPSPNNDGLIATPVIFNPDWTPLSYLWTLDGQVVGQDSTFFMATPLSGELCLSINFENANGDDCSSTHCFYLFDQTWECVDSSQIDPNQACPAEYVPVCGCDNQTYDNECEAFFHGGLTSFSPGPCGQPTDCEVSFTYTQVSGTTYHFEMVNANANQQVFWMFSDGTVVDGQDSVTHSFAGDGSYLVCLTAFDTDLGCFGDMCQIITIGNDPAPPAGSGLDDYVFPGDTDDDGTADLSDLLNIGVDFGEQGLPRPGATEFWYGQLAFDWQDWSPVGNINLKHLDSDGDGEVGFQDADAVLLNGTPMTENLPSDVPGLPKVRLVPVQDTIIITEDNAYEQIASFELRLGSGQNPVQDLYGIAVGFTYPNDLVGKYVGVDYLDNSFLGSSNELLWLNKSFVPDGQTDVSFVRKNKASVSGYGGVAKMDIIIEDAIVLRTGKYIPVNVNIHSVKAIDALGNVKEFAVDGDGTATVVLVNTISATHDASPIDNKVTVYPTVTNKDLNVRLDGLHPRRVEVYNLLSQKILSLPMQGDELNVDVGALPSGQYLIRVFTAEGIITKKFVKQ